MKPKIVIFTGSGISQESGIPTFRDNDGMWENHKIEEVATPEGWKKNKEKVIAFYNERWEKLKLAKPNLAHEVCVELEKDYDVTIVTQNVDDLHERAGSTKVIHLHGNLFTLRSTKSKKVVIPWTEPLAKDLKAPNGDSLRPNVVWFGEPLDKEDIILAMNEIWKADAMIVVGTSLNVEPAASMPEEIPDNSPLIYIDPSDTDFNLPEWKKDVYLKIKEKASTGMVKAKEWLDEMFFPEDK